MTIPMTAPAAAPTRYQTAADYAVAHAPLNERTVKRWLAAGELPGAFKDERGRWLIPDNAVRTTAPASEVIALGQRPTTAPMAIGPTVGLPDMDKMPSFLTVAQAALLLAPATEYAIIHNPEYFGAVKMGENGRWLVPLSTIKRIRGVS